MIGVEGLRFSTARFSTARFSPAKTESWRLRRSLLLALVQDHLQAGFPYLIRGDVGVFLLGLPDQGTDCLEFSVLNIGNDLRIVCKKCFAKGAQIRGINFHNGQFVHGLGNRLATTREDLKDFTAAGTRDITRFYFGDQFCERTGGNVKVLDRFVALLE